jgi:glutamate-1-semialdehyde 2,1-aminomutase
MVRTLDEIFVNKTPNSSRFFDRAVRIFPGGISHNIRHFSPRPFYTRKAKGKFLYDVDNNKYVDYWMGHWALILGHSPEVVVNTLTEQISKGTLYGTANDCSINLGELIQKSIPSIELMRFCTTGSEATMYACRIARASTQKRIVAKAVGGWHGFNTDLMQSVNYPFDLSEGLGLIKDEAKFVESIQYNDLEGSIKCLNKIKEDLACIIIEPLLGGAGCIPASDDYLRGLSEYCKKNNIKLIMDEIVTGYRFGFGTMSEEFKLEADLFTLGKIVGGGLPIGVLGGKKELMRISDPIFNKQKSSRCYIGGGTFSCNPITMSAGLSTLNFLNKNKTKIYSRINELGEKTRTGLSKIFSDYKIDVEITGRGSLFLTHFLNDKVRSIRNANDVALSSNGRLQKYHFALMSLFGIFFLPSKMGAISTKHSPVDVEGLIRATKQILEAGTLNGKDS